MLRLHHHSLARPFIPPSRCLLLPVADLVFLRVFLLCFSHIEQRRKVAGEKPACKDRCVEVLLAICGLPLCYKQFSLAGQSQTYPEFKRLEAAGLGSREMLRR